MKSFSKSWAGSSKPGKQRKYRHNAPLHIRKKLAGAHLSKELRKKYGRRSIPLRKGDTVRITHGNFRKKTGRVERMDIKKSRVYIAGVETSRRDGTKAFIPIDPSKLVITELNLEDRKRQRKFEGQKK